MQDGGESNGPSRRLLCLSNHSKGTPASSPENMTKIRQLQKIFVPSQNRFLVVTIRIVPKTTLLNGAQEGFQLSTARVFPVMVH